MEQVDYPEPMPHQQSNAYLSVIAPAHGNTGGSILAALQRLRSVSLHPAPEADMDHAAFIAASARFAAAFSALDRIANSGERALIFVDDLKIHAHVAAIIQRRYRLASTPMLINGSVSGHVRQAGVDRFQTSREGFDVILFSPRAAGVGLTLTSANHVIHLSRWWNPAVEDQCNGRALRIGQNRPVTVHIPLAVMASGGNPHPRSFDENLNALLERKRRLMHDALIPPEATDAEKEELLQQTLAG